MRLNNEREWLSAIRGAIRGGVNGKKYLFTQLKPYYEAFTYSNLENDTYRGYVFDIEMLKNNEGYDSFRLFGSIEIEDGCICAQIDRDNCWYLVDNTTIIKIKYYSFICRD